MAEAVERSLVEAAAKAVTEVMGRLEELWPGDYRGGLARGEYPAIYDAVETVLQFEVACQLQALVRQDGLEASWEHRYAEDYAARVDLVLAPPGVDRDGPDRTAIELKWMAKGKAGMDGMASDALKLAWCGASARYVLGVGPRGGGELESDLLHAIEQRVEWSNERADLKDARQNFVGCRLVCSQLAGDITVALFRVDQKKTLS